MPDASWQHVQPIREGDVLVHLGPPKTGSTSIQTVMAARREEMRSLGVCYPGTDVRAERAGWAVMGAQPRGLRKSKMSKWDALVQEVDDSGLRGMVSTEAFARATPGAVERIVDSFGADRVHVVAVGRRLDKALPSLYQEKVKKFMALTWEEWLAHLLAGDDLDTLITSFPNGQQLGKIAAKWSRRVGPSRFHLICAEESDRALMPRSFERLLGLPEGFLEPTVVRNVSLDRTTVELLRRVNVCKKERDWGDEFHRAHIWRGAVEALMSHPPVGGQRVPGPPDWALRRIRTLTDHAITRIREVGPHVIGDLERLRPGDDEPAERPASAAADAGTDQVPLDVAVTVLTGALEAGWRREARWREHPPERPPGHGAQ